MTKKQHLGDTMTAAEYILKIIAEEKFYRNGAIGEDRKKSNDELRFWRNEKSRKGIKNRF